MAEIIKIDEDTYRIEDGFVRFFLLTGSDKALMIDSGASCPKARKLCEDLTALPLMLANTHGDGDHFSGTGSFSEIYMHTADFERVGAAYPDVKLVPLSDGDIIDLGGRHLQVIEIPGHTVGSLAFLDIEKRQLFAGDSVQTGHIYMFGQNRCPDKYPESLRKLINLSSKYDSVIASHDTAILPSDSVSRVLNCWNQVLDNSAPFEEIDLWGNKVKSYNCDYCGFYVE